MDKKWNLQDIKPNSAPARKKRAPEAKKAAPEKSEPTETKVSNWSNNTKSSKKGKKSHLLTAIIIFLVIIAGGFGVSALMDGAKVTVFPRHREPTVNAVFTAYQEPAAGELGYEIMTLEADGERQVAATGEEEVTEQATGEITIYKTTEGEERLIKNTRFRSPEGNIYRITESAVVPGGTEADPGSITASVFADEAGEEYNLEGTVRFDVPGFEEGGFTELFESIYAENSTPITGGFDGPRFIVEETELESSLSDLHEELEQALLGRVGEEKPAGFVVFDDAITFNYQSLQSEQAGEGQVILKERVRLQVPIFSESDFASFVARNTIPGYEGEPVRLDRVENLTFTYSATSTESSSLSTVSSVAFRLTGEPQLVWTFDEEQLKSDLAGSARTALNTILGGYPAIERASAVVRPVWKRSFPENVDDITIEESLEENE